MKSFIWLSFAAAVVSAQNVPTIPSGISQTCTDYLKAFNTDAKIQSCITPLLTATARFLPSANMQSNKDDIKWAMDQMCDPKAACKQSDIQTAVTSFYAACQGELVSGSQPSVGTTFELLYAIIPMRNAVCSKSTDGSYCLSKAKKAGGHAKRADDQAQMSQINPEVWNQNNVQYLFMDVNQSVEQLCTACTKQILVAYVSYENAQTFPLGISNSKILGGQKQLWQAITAKCPADFTNGILSSANAAPVNIAAASTGGASSTVLSTTGLLGAIMAAAAALA